MKVVELHLKLPFQATEQHLKDHIEKVTGRKVGAPRVIRRDGMSRGFGFAPILVESDADADVCVRKLFGSELLIDGRAPWTVQCSIAKSRAESKRDTWGEPLPGETPEQAKIPLPPRGA